MRWIAPVSLLHVALAGSAHAVSLTIYPTSYVYVGVSDGTTEPTDFLDLSETSGATDHAIALGANSSTTSYEISLSRLSITFDHARSGEVGASAYSYGVIFFSVDEAIGYAIDGTYTAFDPDGRTVGQLAALVDEMLRWIAPPPPGAMPFQSVAFGSARRRHRASAR